MLRPLQKQAEKLCAGGLSPALHVASGGGEALTPLGRGGRLRSRNTCYIWLRPGGSHVESEEAPCLPWPRWRVRVGGTV